jgi:hypothetical protein
MVVGFLYLFLVGVKGLETGISAFGADFTDRVFGAVSNPLSGLFAGLLQEFCGASDGAEHQRSRVFGRETSRFSRGHQLFNEVKNVSRT